MIDALSGVSPTFYESLLQTPLEKTVVFEVIKTVFSFIKSGRKKILDVGCGTGILAEHCMALSGSHDFTYTGIDVNQAFINYARQRTTFSRNFSFIARDFLSYESKQKYDIVALCGVYHHIPDYYKKKLLAKIAGMLSERGIIVVYEKIIPPYSTKKDYILSNKDFYRKRAFYQFLHCGVSFCKFVNILKGGEISARQEFKTDYQNFISKFNQSGYTLLNERKIWPDKNLFGNEKIGDIIFIFSHGNQV